MSDVADTTPRARLWPAALALSLPVLLAACNHGYDAPTLTPVEASFGVVSADFNGDSNADIAALSSLLPTVVANNDAVKIYHGSGTGHFGTPALMMSGTDPLFLVAADVDGDGAADLVSASYDDGALYVFLHSASSPGTFAAPLVLSSPGASQLAVADMTGDGLNDIVAADFGVSLFVQSAPGTFAPPVKLYSGGANWVALGDLDHDGAPDIALTDANGVQLLMHTGLPSATTYAGAVQVFTPTANANLTGASLIAIADVDGDSYNDLVITDPGPTGGSAPTVNVLLQDKAHQGTFMAPVPYNIATYDRPVSITMRDLTGTGGLDIVIGGEQNVTVLLHDVANPGKFLPAQVYGAPGANAIAIVDVDGDGRLDIVVSNGLTNPVVNGVVTTHPGVLLQSATDPGHFGALADLP